MATIRQQMIATLCLMGGEKGSLLVHYASPADQTELVSLMKRWGRAICPKGRPDEGAERIKKLIARERLSFLTDVHPAWILEKLGSESPRLLGALKYLLGAEQVQYLRSHVSPAVRKVFQYLTEPSPEVLRVLCPLVERQLGLVPPPRVGGVLGFSHLVWMKLPDEKILFRQLGLEEVGQAFSGVEPRIVKTFLSRFPFPMVQEIRSELHKKREEVSAKERGEAQARLVGLSLDQIPVERLFEEVGYSLFARALTVEERERFQVMILRFRPSEGYRFQKILKETRVGEKEIKETKERVLQTVLRLADQGLIRRFWRQEEESTVTERKVA